MNERDQRLMRLQECPGLGPATLSRILDACGGEPTDALYGHPASHYQREYGATPRAADALSRGLPGATLSPEALAHLPVRALTQHDPEYPATFCRLAHKPALLWTTGRIDPALTYDNFAVVASSGAEAVRSDAVKDAIQAGLNAGFRPIAGHNRPVYQWALLAAKREGRPYTMILDRGLLAAFDEDLRRDPVPSARIWGYAFDAEHSLAISAFRLRDGWIGSNARYRDALVVALADVVVAFGVRPGGTMHRLCQDALGRGQAVYADAESLPLLSDAGARPWAGRIEP